MNRSVQAPRVVSGPRDLADAVATVIRGKDDVIRAAVVAILARGHLLLEDVPGVGKTTLARTLARALGGTFQRVQFTSDLLPGDVIGVSVYDAKSGSFTFRSGPIFANIVLADEINRATPKTQSALLEAMAEGQVTVDREAHDLPDPFLVVATQNPVDHAGTYPLPESQLDRFMLRVRVGYPSEDAELELLKSGRPEAGVDDVQPILDLEVVRGLQRDVDSVAANEEIASYVQRIAAATRHRKGVVIGASPRAALHLLRAARALALFEGRDYVVPDDVKQMAPSVLAHRLVVRGGENTDAVIEDIIDEVEAPA